MGFRIVTGSMGGGKSYYATEEMLRAFKEGAIIHTNLEIVPHEWAAIAEHPDQMVELGDDFTKWKELIRPGIEGQENVVVVDEGALIFNARDFASAKAEKQAVFEFMVHSRHLGLDVIFISQHAKNIDAQVRRMTQSIIFCVKAEEVKPYGFLFGKVFGDFRRHTLDPTGRQTWDKTWARFNPEVGKMYRTHMTKGRMDGVQRDVRRKKKEDTSKTRVKQAAIFLACVVAVVVSGIVFLSHRAYATIAGPGEQPAKVDQVNPAPVARVEDVPPPAAKPAAPVQAAKEPRFIPRSCSGRDSHGRFFVDVHDGTAKVGCVYRDAIVQGLVTKGEIIEIHLDDGRTILTRPGTRQDRPPGAATKKKMPWENLPLPQVPFSAGS